MSNRNRAAVLAAACIAAALLPLAPASGAPFCFGEEATVVAGPDQSTVTGTPQRDVIVGSAYVKDRIYALDGNDLVCGRGGNDEIFGGDGDDKLSSGSAATREAADGGPGDDLLTGESGQQTLRGGAGQDTIRAAQGLDTLFGEEGPDTLVGGGERDILAGGPGDDALKGGLGFDWVDFRSADRGVTASLVTKVATGDGSDELAGIDAITGSPSGDDLAGNDKGNRIVGGEGPDDIDGNGGTDWVMFAMDQRYDGGEGPVQVDLTLGTSTGYGSDTLEDFENVLGTRGADEIIGTDGPNEIHGLLEGDTVDAKGGDDLLVERGFGSEEQPADDLTTGEGDDRIRIESVHILPNVDAGQGVDTLVWLGVGDGVVANLVTETIKAKGRPAVRDLIDVENVTTHQWSDTLIGNDEDNILKGAQPSSYVGDDTGDQIYGNGGNDTLIGGRRADTLEGGEGEDSADGQEGTDACEAETETNCEADPT